MCFALLWLLGPCILYFCFIFTLCISVIIELCLFWDSLRLHLKKHQKFRTHYKCTGICLEFADSWECKGAGIFRFMGTPIIRKIPQYRNLPRILRELSDCTGWNNFRLIDSLVLRHKIICTVVPLTSACSTCQREKV